MHDPEEERRNELRWFVISWSLLRRPRSERDSHLACLLNVATDPKRRQEYQAMFEHIEQTWEQELLTRGRAEGELRARREDVRLVLEKRFGPLPEALAQRLEAANDPERLKTFLVEALGVSSLEELNL
jgi:hypothetical protein